MGDRLFFDRLIAGAGFYKRLPHSKDTTMILLYVMELDGKQVGGVFRRDDGEFCCNELGFETSSDVGHPKSVFQLGQWMVSLENKGYTFYLP